MLTGQISSQARHVVHDQTSSAVIRSSTELAPTEISASTVTSGGTFGLAVAAITSPTLRTISRGSSGLPVRLAGHTEVQRPQIVQASVSMSCFQVKSSTFAPEGVELGLHQVGQRLHGALGPGPVPQPHVHRRREHVAQLGGGQEHQEGEEADEVGAPQDLVGPGRCSPTSRRPRRRSASPRTTTSRSRPAVEGDAQPLGQEPGHADEEEHPEDERRPRASSWSRCGRAPRGSAGRWPTGCR